MVLSEDVKRQLLCNVFMHLNKPEYTKYIAELPSMSRRILLCGPAGVSLFSKYNLIFFWWVLAIFFGFFTPKQVRNCTRSAWRGQSRSTTRRIF